MRTVLTAVVVAVCVLAQCDAKDRRILVAGVVAVSKVYTVKSSNTFDDMLKLAGGPAKAAPDNNRNGPKIWPPSYVRIRLLKPVDGTQTLKVPKRLWGNRISTIAPIDNIVSIEFVAAY